MPDRVDATTATVTETATTHAAKPAKRVALAAGEHVAQYRVVREIGRGGMGVVFEAHDERLGRRVAIKVLLGDRDPAELLREARAVAALSHPNVVAVYEVGLAEIGPFLVMELVDGVSLQAWLASERSVRDIVHAFREAGAGLAAAHRSGLVHRDVKLANILVGVDRVRLADFGIANTTSRAGTPGYLAPEVRGEGTVDARADQYAFCVSLAEALTGKRPTGDPPELATTIPRWIRRVLVRGLSPDPAARFPSMEELLRELDRDRRFLWPVVGGLGTAGIAIAAAIVIPQLTAEPVHGPACAKVGHALDGVWDADAKTRVASAFRGLDAGHASTTAREVHDSLDRYARDWVGAAQRACEATRVLHIASDELLDRRMACLDQRRSALATVVTSFASVDKALAEQATNVIRKLPRIAECDDRAYVSTGDGTRVDVGAELMQAKLHLVMFRDQEGIAAAKSAVVAARTAKDVAREAEALVVLGNLNIYVDSATALSTLAQAAELAAKIGAVAIQIDAWALLSQTYQRVGRMTEANQVLGLAFAALATHPDPWREADLLYARGTMFGRRGQFEEARRDFERALALYISVVGPDAQILSYTYANLSTALRRLGKFEEALVQARRGLALALQLGEGHAEVIQARDGIAMILTDLGRPAEAREELDRALRSARATFGERHEKVALLESTLGNLLVANGAFADALPHLEAALTMGTKANDVGDVLLTRVAYAKALGGAGRFDDSVREFDDVIAQRIKLSGATHVDVGHARRQLGELLVVANQIPRALVELAAARRIIETELGAKHRDTGDVLRTLAKAERARGRHRAALAYDEQALPILDATLPATHLELAYARLALAEDLIGVREHARAAEHAQDALVRFEAVGDKAGASHARTIVARTAEQ